MERLAIKFTGAVLAFFLTWFLLAQIDWVEIFQVEKNQSKLEAELGDLYVDMIQNSETLVETPSQIDPIKNIIDQIKEANDIQTEIKLHVVEKDFINAFAIPDGNLVLFTGLIQECQSAEELAGVIGHEMAHIVEKHVMKKLVKEVGLSVLLTMVSGTNSTVVQETFKSLTSSAYDRTLESEADLTSVEYLNNAGIDIRPMADFLFRISLDQAHIHDTFQLMSSHPDSEERARAILEEESYDDHTYEPLMSPEEWKEFQDGFKVSDES